MRAPTIAPAHEGQSADDPFSDQGSSTRPRLVRVAFVATALGLILFLVVQLLLAIHEVGVIRDAIERGELEVYDGYRYSLSSHLPFLVGGALAYLTLAVGGVAVSARGHRLFFAVPLVAYVFIPALMLDTGGVRPEPVGWEWSIDCYSSGIDCSGPWFAHPWFGSIVDMTLVLAPGWLVGRRVRPRRWPGRLDAVTLAAVLSCTAAVATAVWAIAVIEQSADERAIVTTAAFGLALGVARPWWPWLHVLFAGCMAGFIGLMLDFLLWPDPGYPFSDALPDALAGLWPIVAVGLIASAWQPFIWALRRLSERPLRLVIAVNVLNVVDAVMTSLAVRSGHADELNPVIETIGLPAKLVLVGILSWILYRRKPSALIWPAVALWWVAIYHLAGVFVNDVR